MKKILLAIVFLVWLDGLSAQEAAIASIVDSYCERLANLPNENVSPLKLKFENSYIANQLVAKHPNETEQILKSISKKHPDLNKTQQTQQLILMLVEGIIDNCNNYQQLIHGGFPCPEDNETLKALLVGIEEFVEVNKHLPADELFKEVDNQYFNLLVENEKQVNKDYEGGMVNPQLTDDIWRYLTHKSKKFQLAIVSSSVLELLK